VANLVSPLSPLFVVTRLIRLIFFVPEHRDACRGLAMRAWYNEVRWTKSQNFHLLSRRQARYDLGLAYIRQSLRS
jgi:hypothetical protein